MDFVSNDIQTDKVVKIRIEAVGGDLDRVASRYPLSFMNEMARQLTVAIESATGITGIADSSVELVMIFAPNTYLEHISGNVTYRRLVLVDAVSAPRDFWIKWTRLEAVSGEYNADNILFELGEDVDQNIRQREYKYLLAAGKEKYHNSMGRKKVTEWREVLKRAVKRGELGMVETDYELAPETLELEARIADMLGVKIEHKQPEIEETLDVENAPESDEYTRALEKARQMLESEPEEEDELTLAEVADELVSEMTEDEALELEDEEEESSDAEEIKIEAEESDDEETDDEETDTEEEASEFEFDIFEDSEADGEDVDVFDEDEEPASDDENSEELVIEEEFEQFEIDELVAEEITEIEETEEAEEPEIEEIEEVEESEIKEIEETDDEEFVIEDSEEFIIEESEEAVAVSEPEITVEIVEIEEPEVDEQSDEELPEIEVEIYEEHYVEVVEDTVDEEEKIDEPAMEDTTGTEACQPEIEAPTIAERVAEIREQVETKIRLEYEIRAREKAEEELAKLRQQLQQIHTSSELTIAELKRENERLRTEYDRLLEQIESERFTRESEEARRRLEEKQLRDQIETQLRAEADERERLAESARLALEEQHRLEIENARIAREREEAEFIEAERIRREEHERELEAIRQAELDRIAREREEAMERARNAMPDMGDGNPYYTTKVVKLLFRKSVDPNITTHIQQLIKSTVDYYGKDGVYLRIKATVPDTQTVVLEFVNIPIEEMPLLGNIIKVLGNSGLGISKAIIE